jgi:hypothetical protein
VGAVTDAEIELAWRRGNPELVGPVAPFAWLWRQAGEPGFPFNWAGGPLPGTINHPDVLSGRSAMDDAPFVGLSTFDWNET